MRSSRSTPKAEESKRLSYDGTADKRTNQKIGGLSIRDVLKVFKMAIVPFYFPEKTLTENQADAI